MSNFPLGAENDPSAPYNQTVPEYEEVNVLVSAVLSKSIKLIVPYGSTEEDIYNKFFDSSSWNEIQYLELKNWIADNIVVIKE